MTSDLREKIQDILYESNVTRPARVVLATPHNVEVCEIECDRAEKGLIKLFESELAQAVTGEREKIDFESEEYKRYEADIINNAYDYKTKSYDIGSLISGIKQWVKHKLSKSEEEK